MSRRTLNILQQISESVSQSLLVYSILIQNINRKRSKKKIARDEYFSFIVVFKYLKYRIVEYRQS